MFWLKLRVGCSEEKGREGQLLRLTGFLGGVSLWDWANEPGRIAVVRCELVAVKRFRCEVFAVLSVLRLTGVGSFERSMVTCFAQGDCPSRGQAQEHRNIGIRYS